METRHRVEGSLVMNFRRFVNVITAELWRPEVTRRWKKSIFCVFLENDRLRKIFQNSVPKGFIASSIDVLCSNFVKFRRRKIGKVVRYLPDNKNKISPGCPALATARIAPKICQGQPLTM